MWQSDLWWGSHVLQYTAVTHTLREFFFVVNLREFVSDFGMLFCLQCTHRIHSQHGWIQDDRIQDGWKNYQCQGLHWYMVHLIWKNGTTMGQNGVSHSRALLGNKNKFSIHPGVNGHERWIANGRAPLSGDKMLCQLPCKSWASTGVNDSCTKGVKRC